MDGYLLGMGMVMTIFGWVPIMYPYPYFKGNPGTQEAGYIISRFHSRNKKVSPKDLFFIGLDAQIGCLWSNEMIPMD